MDPQELPDIEGSEEVSEDRVGKALKEALVGCPVEDIIVGDAAVAITFANGIRIFLRAEEDPVGDPMLMVYTDKATSH